MHHRTADGTGFSILQRVGEYTCLSIEISRVTCSVFILFTVGFGLFQPVIFKRLFIIGFGLFERYDIIFKAVKFADAFLYRILFVFKTEFFLTDRRKLLIFTFKCRQNAFKFGDFTLRFFNPGRALLNKPFVFTVVVFFFCQLVVIRQKRL